MSRPLSNDLRERVVAALVGGESCRTVAARFGVAVSSVVKWSQRYRDGLGDTRQDGRPPQAGAGTTSRLHQGTITSVERRRRWSWAEKQQLVAATLEPGGSVSAVAREVGVHPGQLYGWRRQLRMQQPAGFAPVRIASAAASAFVAGPGTIEIEFATGARMRVTGAVDTAALTAAVAVLAEGRRR